MQEHQWNIVEEDLNEQLGIGCVEHRYVGSHIRSSKLQFLERSMDDLGRVVIVS